VMIGAFLPDDGKGVLVGGVEWHLRL
jgi:hypothetical protein